MMENSTLLLVIREPGKCSEIISIDEFLEISSESEKMLDIFFSSLDFSPSEEAINRILMHASRR